MHQETSNHSAVMQLVRFRHWILAFALLSCTGCSSLGLSCFPTGHYLTDQAESVLARSPRRAAIARELEQAVVPGHYLRPGDVLLIEPVGFNSDIRIPADQQVLIDGSIDLGGFGRVIVAGLTLEMAENLIERTIVDAGTEKTMVNVRLLEGVNRYYVLGEVNSPGSYPLDGNETVLDGLLSAGGLTSAAAPCKILLARPTLPSSCRITLPVCYREITQLGDTTTNYQLQPGDRIFVASRSWCEELMFWQANQTCPRCSDCQSACVDPAIARVENSMVHVAADRDEGSRSDASIEVIVDQAMPSESKSTDNQALPSRLPSAVDGELEFGPTAFSPTVAAERFEPLWIKPAAEIGSTTSAEPQQ